MPGPTNRAWVPNVLREADGGSRRATIVATGSEVAIALKARSLLQSEGVPTAVVSMPCWELFDEQPEHYRRQVIDRGTVRVAVEAAVRQGWIVMSAKTAGLSA